MRRHDKIFLTVAAIVVIVGGAYVLWMISPKWSGPVVGVQPVEGRDDCWRIGSITPRALRDEDSQILEQVPTYWSEVIVVDYPEARIVDHKMTGEVTVGDVVCTTRSLSEYPGRARRGRPFRRPCQGARGRSNPVVL